MDSLRAPQCCMYMSNGQLTYTDHLAVEIDQMEKTQSKCSNKHDQRFLILHELLTLKVSKLNNIFRLRNNIIYQFYSGKRGMFENIDLLD